jgi:hypothetical protein
MHIRVRLTKLHTLFAYNNVALQAPAVAGLAKNRGSLRFAISTPTLLRSCDESARILLRVSSGILQEAVAMADFSAGWTFGGVPSTPQAPFVAHPGKLQLTCSYKNFSACL